MVVEKEFIMYGRGGNVKNARRDQSRKLTAQEMEVAREVAEKIYCKAEHEAQGAYVLTEHKARKIAKRLVLVIQSKMLEWGFVVDGFTVSIQKISQYNYRCFISIKSVSRQRVLN